MAPKPSHKVARGTQPPVGFGAQQHVVQRGHGVDQHEVLVHHAHTRGHRFTRVADAHLATAHFDGALIGLIEAVKDGHQGALARPVLAHDAMHRAGLHAQVDCPVGVNGTKSLVDAAHPNGQGTAHRPHLPALPAM